MPYVICCATNEIIFCLNFFNIWPTNFIWHIFDSFIHSIVRPNYLQDIRCYIASIIHIIDSSILLWPDGKHIRQNTFDNWVRRNALKGEINSKHAARVCLYVRVRHTCTKYVRKYSTCHGSRCFFFHSVHPFSMWYHSILFFIYPTYSLLLFILTFFSPFIWFFSFFFFPFMCVCRFFFGVGLIHI